MNTATRPHDDLRGLGRLAVDGVTGMTDLVEAVHAAIAHLPAVIGRPAPASTRGLARLVYTSVRRVAQRVGDGVDLSLSALAPLLTNDGVRSPQREAWVAMLNGVIGDHLEASGNPLAVRMQFRSNGAPLALTRAHLAARLPRAGGRLLVQLHGLCMNDLQWNRSGHDHGAALARALGYTPVHLYYNSGRNIWKNGRDFADLLEGLVDAWPTPVQEITLLCHSMGGLVARSALDVAFVERLAWADLPLQVVFLGTPHHGSPLERAGSWADQLIGITPYSAPFARVGKLRSAGIQDLRHGCLRDSRHPRTPVPLPRSVRAFAIAGTTQTAHKPGGGVGLRAALLGDGLVPVASALGDHRDPAFDLGIPPSRRWVGHGIGHLQMLGSEAVFERIAGWLDRSD